MGGGTRRGGIPGPESRTGLVRPAMTEAEFERRQQATAVSAAAAAANELAELSAGIEPEASRGSTTQAPSAPARNRVTTRKGSLSSIIRRTLATRRRGTSARMAGWVRPRA